MILIVFRLFGGRGIEHIFFFELDFRVVFFGDDCGLAVGVLDVDFNVH
jgi:hypothetical protein